jgi:membrane protein DedA with SNARE-associated domain
MWDIISAGFNELLAFVESVDPRYIYLILFSVAFIENIFPPFPGDTFTIVAGYMAALGKLTVLSTLAAVSFGTFVSVMLIYYVSYRHGRPLLIRKKYTFFTTRDIARVQTWFGRFGAWTLIFSRFVVGGRVAIAAASGMGRYPAGRMAIFSLVSAVLFHGTLIGLAFLMHAYIRDLVDGFGLYSKIVLVIVAVLIILWIVILIRRVRRGKKNA